MRQGGEKIASYHRRDGRAKAIGNFRFMLVFERDRAIDSRVQSIAVTKQEKQGEQHHEKVRHKEDGVFNELRALRDYKGADRLTSGKDRRFHFPIRDDHPPNDFLPDPAYTGKPGKL